MTIRQEIYKRLAQEVAAQSLSERDKTIVSSGLPHYRVPRSMASETMACCPVMKPCEVHAQYKAGQK